MTGKECPETVIDVPSDKSGSMVNWDCYQRGQQGQREGHGQGRYKGRGIAGGGLIGQEGERH